MARRTAVSDSIPHDVDCLRKFANAHMAQFSTIVVRRAAPTFRPSVADRNRRRPVEGRNPYCGPSRLARSPRQRPQARAGTMGRRVCFNTGETMNLNIESHLTRCRAHRVVPSNATDGPPGRSPSHGATRPRSRTCGTRVTSAERIARWFLPVSGNPRAGRPIPVGGQRGRYDHAMRASPRFSPSPGSSAAM